MIAIVLSVITIILIAKIVISIEVKCTKCGKPKDKIRFHAHHPDRTNQPDYKIPLFPSCHTVEEPNLRRERENKPPYSLNPALPTIENTAIKPRIANFSSRPRPLSPLREKAIAGLFITFFIESLFPGFIDKSWQEIKCHLNKS